MNLVHVCQQCKSVDNSTYIIQNHKRSHKLESQFTFPSKSHHMTVGGNLDKNLITHIKLQVSYFVIYITLLAIRSFFIISLINLTSLIIFWVITNPKTGAKTFVSPISSQRSGDMHCFPIKCLIQSHSDGRLITIIIRKLLQQQHIDLTRFLIQAICL